MSTGAKFLAGITLTTALLATASPAHATDADRQPPPRPGLPQGLSQGEGTDAVAQIASLPNRLPLLQEPLLGKLLEGLRNPHAPKGVGVRILPGRLRRGSDYLIRVHCPTNANTAHVISPAFNSVGQRDYRRTVLGLPYLIHGTGHFTSPQPIAHDLAVGVYRVHLRCLRVRHNPLKAYSKRVRHVVAHADAWIVVRRFRLNHF
jgi:hypothetical protein